MTQQPTDARLLTAQQMPCANCGSTLAEVLEDDAEMCCELPACPNCGQIGGQPVHIDAAWWLEHGEYAEDDGITCCTLCDPRKTQVGDAMREVLGEFLQEENDVAF